MQRGKEGMSNHKHHISGHTGRGPRYKHQQQLDCNKVDIKKPKIELKYSSASEAIKNERPR